tara:strand:+ start:227 stop:601 length:375 start_codon:yes stop_codon:yes gene_type:complete
MSVTLPVFVEKYKGYGIFRFTGYFLVLDGYDYIQQPFASVEVARAFIDGAEEKEIEPPRALGLYRIFWKSGGTSLASVGQTHDGTRWFAPCNWTGKNENPLVASTDWKLVSRFELIDVIGENVG